MTGVISPIDELTLVSAMLKTFEIVSRAVADPTRVRILKLLGSGELCVCQITAILNLAPATISKHLTLLKSAGLVQQRRDGKWVYYRLAAHNLNDYARPFLALVERSLRGDPTIAQDQVLLAQVLATPVLQICERGRGAIIIPAGTTRNRAVTTIRQRQSARQS